MFIYSGIFSERVVQAVSWRYMAFFVLIFLVRFWFVGLKSLKKCKIIMIIKHVRFGNLFDFISEQMVGLRNNKALHQRKTSVYHDNYSTRIFVSCFLLSIIAICSSCWLSTNIWQSTNCLRERTGTHASSFLSNNSREEQVYHLHVDKMETKLRLYPSACIICPCDFLVFIHSYTVLVYCDCIVIVST